MRWPVDQVGRLTRELCYGEGQSYLPPLELTSAIGEAAPTVDDLEPKAQNQDSPHQNVKVSELPRFLHPQPQNVFTFTLVFL
jgi:hypothetical protein